MPAQTISPESEDQFHMTVAAVAGAAWLRVVACAMTLAACTGSTKGTNAQSETRAGDAETLATMELVALPDGEPAKLADQWVEAGNEQTAAGEIAEADSLGTTDSAAPEVAQFDSTDSMPADSGLLQDIVSEGVATGTESEGEENLVEPDPWAELESLVDDVLLAPPKQVTAAGLAVLLAEDPDHFFIVDLRGASLWGQGHIAGAIDVSLGNLWAFLAAGNVPAGKPLLLVCHAGQQSAWAAALINMMGFDAWSLQWGMPAWNASGGNMWASACSDQGKALKVTDAAPPPPDSGFPVVDFEGESAQTALHARAASFLGGTFKTKTYDAVAGSLDQYFIVAHVSQQEFDAGHLPGAIRFEPGVALDAAAQLDLLPPDSPILVYDCTGEGAATVAAALNVLGYDAWFLKFGVSSMWCSDLDCAWSPDKAGSYPVEAAGDGT